MNATRRRLLAAALLPAAALAQPSPPMPAELQSLLPQARLGGSTHFTFLGFAIYDATLWVGSDFTLASYARHVFALELTYQRHFDGVAIADRSVTEMRRQPGASEAQLSSWGSWMRGVFPDVRKGDRIAGLHHPKDGAQFLYNGRTLAALTDPEFAHRFFGIWLSEQSSDQRLREAVIRQLAGR